MLSSREDKEHLLELLKEKEERTRYNYIDTIFPDQGELLEGCLKDTSRSNYPKHIEFLNAGANYVERAFIAGNRTGKTLTGLYEMVRHCIGIYPKWWKGKRFTRPVQCWLVGDRGDTIRDGMQRLLMGRDGRGTGLIPANCLIRESALQGTPGGIGVYYIKHIPTGRESVIVVKTYQAGKNAFESAEVDVAMLDEECPMDIYVETQMRVLTTGGTVYLTFTPDSGLTDTVIHFFDKPKPGEPEKFKVMVGWNDVPHLSEERKAQLLATIPPHMRDVKTKGIPYLGAGAIYPVQEVDITYTPFTIPAYWPKCYAFDPGWNKTAALWGAYDVENDTWYLYSEYYRGQAEPEIHSAAIKSKGEWMYGVADPHGSKNGKGVSAESFLKAYERFGLNLTLASPCGPGSVEIGINEVYSRLSTGRLKIASSLVNWFYEYRIYRRDDKGRIVATNNHLMDTTRYIVLSGASVMSVQREEEEWDRKTLQSDVERSDVTGY